MDTTGRRVSGAQVVYTTLYDRITSLELAPGTRLHETELAASLAVSRTPLREALRMLLADGLVHQLPTGGMVVSSLDPQEMRHLYEVRSVLEGVVARQACEQVTDAVLAELERLQVASTREAVVRDTAQLEAEAAQRQRVRGEISTMVSERPDEVAAMLRGWLTEKSGASAP